jgi:RimJ/RimL family protein N-acetyltransferase
VITPVDSELAGPTAELGDGTEVAFRPIQPGDVAGLVEFHEGLSFETVYRRFFGVHPHLGANEAEHFCTVDTVDRYALVALVGATIVGVARLERLQPATNAEVAFVIADEFQHRGLGRLLAQRLAVMARQRGIRQFVADVLPDNRAMLHLLPDAGFSVKVTRCDGICRVTCPLD